MVKHPQLWMVFFGPGIKPGKFASMLSRPWQHVCCASFEPEQQIWRYVNPARDRTYFLTMTPEQFEPYFARLLRESTAVLEVAARDDRAFSPTWASCVGAVKGILGVRSWAVTPYQLYRFLRVRGASLVSLEPAPEDAAHGQPFRRRRTSSSPAGGPGGDAAAAAG